MTLSDYDRISGLKVTVMGLGLNDGGLSVARFFASRGAIVTVTDLKDAQTLAPSIEALSEYSIRYVLGRHEMEDFTGADLVIKNPGVRLDNPFLKASRNVDTDISIFLKLCKATVVAVTGSKGKSTTASAIAHVLNACGKKAYLGGNITVSPLGFLDIATRDDVVVLELSSWQLGDLAKAKVLKPKVAVITRIVPDHLDRYGTMDAYIADKRLIYANQDENDFTVCEHDDWGKSFASETKAKTLWYGSATPDGEPGARLLADGSGVVSMRPGESACLLPSRIKIPGQHNRNNMLAAGLAAMALGLDAKDIAAALASFGGVEHRLELFAEHDGIQWCNDSTATVPEAVQAAISAFTQPIVLISGGTDKQLDFKPVRHAYKNVKKLILLAGSGTEKLRILLDEDKTPYLGPFSDLREALDQARLYAKKGDIVILSPGCTSFGMFKNEFDRGNSFKAAVREIIRE